MDLDDDGRHDVIAADAEGNRLALHLSSRGGLAKPSFASTFKAPKQIATGRWDTNSASVFVLSEEEKTVGVSRFDAAAARLEFPQPITIATAGGTPVAIAYVDPDNTPGMPARARSELTAGDLPALAIVVQDGRDHAFELHRPIGGGPTVVELEGVRRSPQSVRFGDFNADDAMDAVLLTPGEPMIMIADINAERHDEPVVLQSDDMPQFGLVQSAGPDNTTVSDVNNDLQAELVIADANFVRAAAYDADRGWRVVEQANAPLIDAAFSGLTTLGTNNAGLPVFAAADRQNGELVIVHAGEPMAVTDRVELEGIDLSRVLAADTDDDGTPEILCPMEEGFALVAFEGPVPSLEQFAAFRSDEENRLEHELGAGDLNSDGYLDIVVLDAREQMLQIFSLSAAREMRLATEFTVFESRIFTGGERNQFEPSAAFIEDVTGDGANDLILQVHDRVLIYPQQTRAVD